MRLDEIARQLASGTEDGRVLHRIAEVARDAAAATAVYLERIDRSTNEVEIVAAVGVDAPALGARVPYPGSLTQEAVDRDAPEVVEPEELSRRFIAPALTGSCLLCRALVVPLISAGEAMGALILMREQAQAGWEPEEMAQHRLLADMAAIAMGRMVLQEQFAAHIREHEERERSFRLLVETVRDYAIFMLDADGNVASWNAGAERIKGYSADEIIGLPLETFYEQEDRERGHPRHELRIAAEEGQYQEEGWRLRKDGGRFRAHVTITALRDGNGRLVGFAKVTRDLTERLESEVELADLLRREQAAREEAERANSTKSDFLATMSHEIRTPINAIMGYTDLLELGIAGALNEAQHAQLGRIRSSSNHLLGLIDDILDMSKAEAGRMELQTGRAAAGHAVSSALALIRPQAAARSVELVNECPRDAQAEYCGDEDRVRQILVNLLSNAVKFTPEGGRVSIRCNPVAGADPGMALPGNGPWVRFDVTDNGIGVRDDEQDAIFQPFLQASSGHTREHGGTGLGLTISRQLARLMSGEVTVRSEVGHGSTFSLWLPQPHDGASAEPAGGTRRDAIVAVGRLVGAEVSGIMDTFVRRIRQDPTFTNRATLSDAELQDHGVALLSDIAQSMVVWEAVTDEPENLLRDGGRIQRVIAELHGLQRHRIGWGEQQLLREFEILREEMRRVVDGRVSGFSAEDVEGALGVLMASVDSAERVSLRSLRAVSTH
jgi:PAS domain S-box-containing protein